jgi:hypothetical protein
VAQLAALDRAAGCSGTSYNFSARVAIPLTPGTPTAAFTVGNNGNLHVQVSDPTNSGNWAFGKTTFTLTYQTVGNDCAAAPCNGKAILYQDPNNGSRFYQATPILSSYGGSFGNSGGTSTSATIPASGPTTWYVQLVPDPRYFAPIPTPSPYAFTASWNIMPSP